MSRPTASFTDEAVQRCPFPFIKALHAHAPVYRDPVSGFFVVSRYDDIAHVADHPEIFSNKTTMFFGGDPDQPGHREMRQLYADKGWARMHTLATNDPPSHTHFRSLVDKIFTPSFVRRLEPYVSALCDELIDAFIADGRVNLHRDYCIKVPMYVIADQLGVPREKWDVFKIWSDAQVELINPVLSAEERLRLAGLNIDMQQYLAGRQADYQARPNDKLLSLLANAEMDGRRLTTQEFVNIAQTFLVAGNETTTSGIARVVDILIRRPDLMARIRADPTRIPKLVEEVLRLHAPSPYVYRTVLADTTLSGVPLPAGSLVMLNYLGGNYDERRFACPETLDLDRPGGRQHMAFGRGIHHCIGNQLARAEIRIALERLLARLDDIRFDPASPEPRTAAVFHVHQLESISIVFDAARDAAA